jgi:hypothetical protein
LIARCPWRSSLGEAREIAVALAHTLPRETYRLDEAGVPSLRTGEAPGRPDTERR